MRKLFLFSICILICSLSFTQTVSVTQKIISEPLLAIYFIDANNGFATTKDGKIIKTSDGFNTWSIKESGTNRQLFSICFVNSKTGWITGANCTILKTTDGGENWSLLSTTLKNDHFFSVYFVDENVGYIATQSGLILKTIDGGVTWVYNIKQVSPFLYSVFFTGSNTGFAVGGTGYDGVNSSSTKILKTTDGGDNWTQISNGISNGFLRSIFFINSNTGFAAGIKSSGNGIILKTTDGGNSWTEKSIPLTYGLWSVKFSDANNGLCSGDGGFVLKTSDGGETWTDVSDNNVRSSNQSIYSVYYLNAESGWQVTTDGTLVKYSTASNAYANVTTTDVSSVSESSASSGGNVLSEGNSSVITRGVCWSSNVNPTINDNKTTNGGGIGKYSCAITGLIPNTLYFVRAYATNGSVTAYGNQVSFTTLSKLPVVSTTESSAITSNSMTSGGNVSYDGGEAVSARGVCWSTNQNPTTADNNTTNGTGSGSFTSNITGLNPNTTYYLRAYATNSSGTSYGNQITFKTLQSVQLPTVSTSVVSSITKESAISGGNVSSDGGGSISARGVCWSTSENPTTADSKTNDASGSGTFSSTLSGLAPGTTYYIRAYATNNAGTAYGNQLSFNTLVAENTTPSISTAGISSITSSSAVCGGNITSDGGASIIHKGICWSINPNPTISDLHNDEGPGIGSFMSSITFLEANTKYYVRAYATNSVGIAYGNEVSFTTPQINGIPVMSATTVVNILSAEADVSGYIESDGGNPLLSRGICWSRNPDPTINDNKTSNGTETGAFTHNIKGLAEGTFYYVRSYATNSAGTSYGSENIFTTSTTNGLPVVKTSSVSNITENGVTTGGYITGCDKKIVLRGVCWSTSPNPTRFGHTATSASETGSGTFITTVISLEPNTRYFLKAFATTDFSTFVYGDEITFTTTPAKAGPVLETVGVSNIKPNFFTCEGKVISDGGFPITEKGFCYGFDDNPTIDDYHSNCGTGNISYSCDINGSLYSNTYYVRAYAINRFGTGYGNVIYVNTDQNSGTLKSSLTDVKNITLNSAKCSVDIITNSAILSKGVCWDIHVSPTISNSKTENGSDLNDFEVAISGLLPNTKYYIRPYTTDNSGTSYGAGRTITTLPDVKLPMLLTEHITDEFKTTAISGGYVLNDGDGTITARGVCWNTKPHPTIDNNKTIDGTGAGSFESHLSGLNNGSVYYVRAYATNSAGTGYGNEIVFTKVQNFNLPDVSTNDVSEITTNSAKSGGSVNSDGGASIIARGVCWSISQNPTIFDSKSVDGTGTGSFISNIDGLLANTTYYVRAYATNNSGTAYGSQKTLTSSFKAPDNLPVITTTGLNYYSPTGVKCGGNIISDGGSFVHHRGICFGNNPNPAINNSSYSNDGTGIGTFTTTIALSPDKTYYFRAYAINSTGVVYGNQISIYSLPALPIVATSSVGMISSTSVTCVSSITYKGGSEVSSRGICYSTTSSPTISDSKTIDGKDIGTYSSSISGLTPNTTYYLRSYATNATGTSYGNELKFTTKP